MKTTAHIAGANARQNRPAAPGFALAEATATLVVLLVVFAMVLAMAPRQRRMAQLGESMANLKEFGTLTGLYAADNADRYWTFSWIGDGRTVYPTPYIDLRGPYSEDVSACAGQAVDILRRRGNRQDFPRLMVWFPHVSYSHLVLADYAALQLPLRIAVSPADDRLVCWSNDPRAFDRAECPVQPAATVENKPVPYSSSYELGTAFYSPDRSPTIVPGATHSTITWNGSVQGRMGNRRQNEVTHPSHKAMMWDRYQRHEGDRQPYFMTEEARFPVLFADGAAWYRSGADANKGWHPSTPVPGFFPTTTYAPETWEQPLPDGLDPIMTGRQRFTRSGLAGRDLDGDEVE